MGFRNAPAIDKYAVGMRFNWEGGNGKWWTVVHINSNGYPYCVSDGGLTEVFGNSIMEKSDLDLESVWIGRKYKHKDGTGTATVLAFGSDIVCYQYVGGGGQYQTEQWLTHFKRDWTPRNSQCPVDAESDSCPVRLHEPVRIGNVAGMVEAIDYQGRRFWIAQFGPFPFDAKITKLVPGESHATV